MSKKNTNEKKKLMVCCECGNIDESYTAYCPNHHRSIHILMTQKEYEKVWCNHKLSRTKRRMGKMKKSDRERKNKLMRMKVAYALEMAFEDFCDLVTPFSGYISEANRLSDMIYDGIYALMTDKYSGKQLTELMKNYGDEDD